jgi:hypothetical protein
MPGEPTDGRTGVGRADDDELLTELESRRRDLEGMLAPDD